MKLDMPRISVGCGIALAGLGVGTYFASGQSSVTALIPAAFGVVLLMLGLVAKRPAATKHAMHAAATVALLGLLGTARGLADVVTLLGGGTVERPLAVGAMAAMALTLATFLWLCVQSFRAARKARQ